MSRDELKEIVRRVIERIVEVTEAPGAACIFSDDPCDITSAYSINEES
jgi:hypothetical protein